MVEIHRISQHAIAGEELWGGWIDSPTTGQAFEVQDFDIHGWVIGRGRPVVAVEVIVDHPLLRNCPYWKPTPIQVTRPRFERPDVANRYPPEAEALRCGFHTTLGASGLPRQFALHLRAVLDDNRRVSIGRIEGSRQPLRSSYAPELQPTILTFLGRTGSTLVMQMLAQHPQMVVHCDYPYETKAAGYWLHMLRVLAGAPEHTQALHLRTCEHQRVWIGQHPFYTTPLTDDPLLHQWFGRKYPQMLAEFSQQAIDSFYLEVARAQNQPRPRRFIEKWGIGSPHGLVEDLYPRAKELLLVRDFRDMVCSMLAFNAKSGHDSARQRLFKNDAEYIRSMRVDALWLLDRYRNAAVRPFLLRYEDLVLRPGETLAAVLKYLEVDDCPELVERLINNASAGEVFERHKTSSDVRSSIGRWERDLDYSLQKACEEAFGDALEAFGYTDSAAIAGSAAG